MNKRVLLATLIFIVFFKSYSTDNINLKEAIFTPTAYTPLLTDYKKNEKHLRIGLYGAGLYIPREEVDNIKGQSLSVLNFNIKWKILEDNGIIALATEFNGFYPLGFYPEYMENEIFGSMYLTIGKAISNFNFNTAVLYGTLMDIFIFNEEASSNLEKEPNLSVSGNIIYNLTDWSDYKVEMIKPVTSEDYLIATSFAVNALEDHVCWDIGVLTRTSSDRNFEYFIMCKLKL